MAEEISPISHLEKVIVGEESPISHLEKVIALYGGTGGSGGSGTTNYNALLNKPSINGVDLIGNKTLTDLGITNYNDAQVKKDIADLQADKQDKTDNALDTTDKTVVGAINEINGNALDTVTFSADYKNIIINRKSGNNPYTIPIASIIHNAKLIELNDVDSANIGDGKTLVYDGTTKKHKYVDSTGTDEFVKMDGATDAKHLSDLIDKQTIVNDNGVLKAKKLDGQNVTIAEINHLKGLTMNVMDLVNAFANGGVKVLNTPVATHADLSKLDRSTFLDGISYIVYVLADETHSGAKTTYLCNKTSETFFGNADSQRNFTTDPINLANEVTGKLGTANIDVDALWKLLTINDTYKTLTAKNEPFGTHGAKALYDELVADIGKKANATDLTTHTSDTDIHITTAERTKWNKIDDKIEALKSTQSLEYEGTVVTCENTLASRTSDMIIKGNTYQNLDAGVIESAGQKENKISILSKNKESADDIDYKECKKEILLPIEGGLKLLHNGVYDTIEQRSDGVYLVQRVKKMPLYGSVTLNYPQEQNSTNTVLIYFTNTHDATPNTNNILCNAIKSCDAVYDIWNSSFDKEGVILNYKADLLIRINKSRLNTVDYDGIKKFINDNQLTVYYALKTPVETKLDINNLDLEVYKDATYVATDNAIQPTLSFKVPSNIGGVIQSNAQNVNKLYKQINEVVDNKADKSQIHTHSNKAVLDKITQNSLDTWNDGARRIAFIGSDVLDTNGWYKVAEQTCGGYGDTNITFMVTSTFKKYHSGILQLQIRSDATYISCQCFKWLSRIGFPISNFIIVINGMTWTLYAYQPNTIHGRIVFEILSMSSLDSKNMTWTLNFKDNYTKETTAPVATVTSSDGASNVPVTNITLNNGFTGVVSYEVKNGVCYVNLDAFKSEKTGQELIVSETLLPKPSIGTVTSTVNFDRDETKTGMVCIIPHIDNRLRMHCYRTDKNGWCTFSYPVAEQ